MFFSRAKIGSEEPIDRVWKLDWKLASCSHGDCYRGINRQTKATSLVWITPRPLTSEQGLEFIAHVKALTATGVVASTTCGVDTLGQGYVVFPGLSGKSLCYDQPDIATIRQRFLACVLLVAEVHAQGYACGNISEGSFVIGEEGNPMFIGCCGGYQLESAEQVPLEARKYLASGSGVFTEPDPVSDVYALSVLGLSLYGAQFPPSGITAENIDACLEKLSDEAPSWARSLLAQIVTQSDQALFKDAGEFLYAIKIRERSGQPGVDAAQAQAAASREVDTDDAPAILSPIRAHRRSQRRGLWLSVTGAALVLALVVVVFGLGNQGNEARQSNQSTSEQLKSARALISAGLRHISDAERFVQAGDVDLRKELLEKILEGARSHGSLGAATFVQEVLAANASLLTEQAAAGGALLEFLNPSLNAAERRGVLMRYSTGQRELAAIGAAAIVFDKPAEGALYRDVLTEHLKAVAPQYMDARSEAYCVEALALATDINNIFPQATEEPVIQKISDEELWWVLRLHAHKRSPKVFTLARIAESRPTVTWPRGLYLRAIYESAGDLSAPYESLVLSAEQGAASDAIQKFASWYSTASERALYVVLMESPNSADKKLSLDALLNKPHANPVVSPLIDAIRSYDESALVEFATVIGAAGLSEDVPPEMWEAYLKQLRGSQLLSPVSRVVFSHGSTRFIRGFLGQFGRELNPDLVLPLLQHPDALVRKAVIPLLKNLPLASSRAALESARRNERDAEVLEAYRREL